MPPSLFLVRVRRESNDAFDLPVASAKAYGIEAVFATRDGAEAFLAELEQRAAEAGEKGPLAAVPSLEHLRQLSDFDPGVLRDWLTDHDIPEPETFVPERPVPADDERTRYLRLTLENGGYLDWLMSLSKRQTTDLYAALHRFRVYEVVEVPFVAGDYPPEEWEEWERAALAKPLPAWMTAESLGGRASPARGEDGDNIPF